jgi:DNA-binding NarL/FixJ family response regulator
MSALAAHEPDCAIVDIRMPPTQTEEGIVAARRIREFHPTTGVRLLSQYVEPAYAMQLLGEHPERAGYLLKDRPAHLRRCDTVGHERPAGLISQR